MILKMKNSILIYLPNINKCFKMFKLDQDPTYARIICTLKECGDL